ncbi:MAG: MOSC domain-containing protein [Candidatus Binatia bacterium]
MESIGRIGGLWRYPVKSLAGEPLVSAMLDETGIIGDRRWALKNIRTGELVNCKVLTSLLTVGAAYRDEPKPGYGVVHAEITLPDGRKLMTSDPSVNAAISAIAGQPLELWPLLPPSNAEHYRLRRPFTPELTKQRMGLNPDDPYPDFSTYEPEMIEELHHFFSPRGSYKDAYPLHYVTSASLATLESYHPGLDVTPRRFRPNFYIEGVEAGGFPELGWSGYDLAIGDAVLNCGEETVRCVMPSQAQMGLKAEPHMGFVLNRVTKLKLGAYCHIRKAGMISVGDEVFLERQPKFRAIRSKILPLPENIARGEVPGPPPLTPFYKARVVRKRRETADTISFGFKMPPGQAFPFLPGQHLIFRLRPSGHARPFLRSYSLSSERGLENRWSGVHETWMDG